MPSGEAPFARKITVTLFTAQSLASAGVISAATVASIVGAQLSGRTSLAGLPGSVFQLGAALLALVWGLASDRFGRRGGLSLGVAVGAGGALLAGWAVAQGNFWLLLPALALAGSGSAAVRLGRFVAAEVSPPQRRGRAVATVVLGGTVGSVLGPVLVAPTGRWALALGLPELAGPYAATLFAFALASLALLLGLRPEPKRLGEALERRLERVRAADLPPAPPRPPRGAVELSRDPVVFTAVAAMVVAQAVMVALMMITSLHLSAHGHTLEGIAAVYSSHTFGMYAFSILSGQLTDRWGRQPALLLGAAVMIVACLCAPLSHTLVPMMLSLFALGLGWNLLFVGGSALLSDALAPAEKARTQGVNDLLIGLVAAGGTALSGAVYAAVGYALMGLGAAAVVAALVPVVIWRLRGGRAASGFAD